MSECASFEDVRHLASFIAEHCEIGAALLDHYDGYLDKAKRAISDRCIGEHTSLVDYVQELTGETAAVPQLLRFYIDWQAIVRDAELNGDLFAIRTAYDVVHFCTGC